MMAPATISALRPTGRPAARGSAPRPRTGRTTVVPRAGFLDFMIPKPGGSTSATARGPARAKELVDQLLDLSAGTDAGLKASPSRRDEIDEVVSELAGYCMRSPLRSDLIFGEWEVVYASKPQTAGGPFRSPLGRTVFPGQRAIQVIAEPNLCVNEVSYKTLGFIPGAARQEGEIEPVNETTFQITFPGLDKNKRGAGGPPQRLIEVVYLDEKIRVARAVPQQEGEEGSFYVFARVGAEEEEEEEAPKPAARAPKRAPPPPPAPKRRQARAVQEEEEEEEEPARKGPAFNLFPARKSPAEGRATMAERAVARAGTGSTRGTQRLATKPATQAGTQKRGGTGTTRTAATAAAPTRKTREELAAERAAAAAEAKARAEEERRARAEAAAEAKARAEAERQARAEAAAAARAAAEEERRAKAEAAAAARAALEEERRRAKEAADAERAAAAKRQEAAKEAYAELAEAANEAADEAREAATAYKAAEKEAAALIRAAGQARGIIERAVAAAEEAAAELLEAQTEEVAADKDVLEGQRLVNALEKRLRDVSAAVAPRIKK